MVQWLWLFALACAARPAAGDGWKLVWGDEFDGPAGSYPDPSNWKYDVGGGGFGNQEQEWYCAAGSDQPPCSPLWPNAVHDGGGNLVVQAILTGDGNWTSARLKTEGLQQFQYGRVEARMLLPCGPGLWPAFWMVGADIDTVGWPQCGEIDMMENVPGDVPGGLGNDTIRGTAHGPGYSGTGGIGKSFQLPGGGRVDTGFHVYGALWSQDSVEFYVDDWTAPYFSVRPASLPPGAAWVFNAPFFIILNLAVGGDWPGPPTPGTPSPARMLVDYVRVYSDA